MLIDVRGTLVEICFLTDTWSKQRHIIQFSVVQVQKWIMLVKFSPKDGALCKSY